MKSIRTKILLCMALTVSISLIVVGAVSVYLNFSSTNETLEQAMLQTAKVAAERVRQELNAQLNVAIDAGSIARLADPERDVADKKAIIDQRAQTHQFQRGNIIGSDGISIFDGNDYSDREYFKQAMQGNVFVSDPVISKVTGELTFVVAAPLWQDGIPETKVVGAVYFIPAETFLNDIVMNINVSEHGSAYILNAEGTTIAHKNMDNVKNAENTAEDAKSDKSLAALAALEQQMTEGKSGFGQYTYGGVTKFLAYAPIDIGNGWSLAINAPLTDFTGSTVLGIILTIALLLLAVLISVVIATVLAGRIGKPIHQCADRLDLLAKGDLASGVPTVTSKDETGKLADATKTIVDTFSGIIKDIDYGLAEIAGGNFQADSQAKELYVGDFKQIAASMYLLMDHLSDTLLQVRVAADQVSGGASQVSAGAQALSQGATEQASAVEELAATIGDISGKVQGTADSAVEGRARSNSTGEEIKLCNGQMQKLVEAMTEITDKSSEIGKIIKTIEDIAFQTNILALNAAVEAARAGAAGKGFAVVADEVRNLANKSQEASKNTSVLIEGSIEAVNRGTRIVDETANSLLQVVEGAQKVTATVDEIASAASGEAEAISQVTQGIDQISSVVQTNSATAEESAAASEELSGQAQMLRELVGKFRLSARVASQDTGLPALEWKQDTQG